MPLKVDKKGQTASRPHLGKTLKTRRQFFHQNNESREIPFWKARAFPGKPYHHPQCIPLSHEKSSTNWIHVFLLDFPHYFFGGPGFHFHFDKYETKQKIVRCYKHFFIWKHLHCHPGLCSLFVIRKSTNHVWKKRIVFMMGIWGLSSKWKGFWVFQVWFQPVSTLKKNSSSFFPRKLSH